MSPEDNKRIDPNILHERGQLRTDKLEDLLDEIANRVINPGAVNEPSESLTLGNPELPIGGSGVVNTEITSSEDIKEVEGEELFRILDERREAVRQWAGAGNSSARYHLLPKILGDYSVSDIVGEMEKGAGIEDKAFQWLLSVQPEIGEAVLGLAILRKHTDNNTNLTLYGPHYLAALELVRAIRALDSHKNGQDHGLIRKLKKYIRTTAMEFMANHGVTETRLANLLDPGKIPDVYFNDLIKGRKFLSEEELMFFIYAKTKNRNYYIEMQNPLHAMNTLLEVAARNGVDEKIFWDASQEIKAASDVSGVGQVGSGPEKKPGFLYRISHKLGVSPQGKDNLAVTDKESLSSRGGIELVRVCASYFTAKLCAKDGKGEIIDRQRYYLNRASGNLKGVTCISPETRDRIKEAKRVYAAENNLGEVEKGEIRVPLGCQRF